MTVFLTHQTFKSPTQVFSFFSESSWNKEKKQFPKTLGNFFSGKKKEFFVINEDHRVTYLIGLGNDVKNFEIQQVASLFSNQYSSVLKPVSTKLNAEFLDSLQIEELIKGLFLGTYSYPFKNEHPFWKKGFEISIPSLKPKELEKIKLRTEALCEGQFACMEWLNKPANYKKTNEISAFLKATSKKYNLEYQVFDRKACEKLGLGAFLSVNQGSSMEAAFTVLEYKTSHKNAKTIGLVGKCVLFDTGGISIKGSANMHYMKSDLGGATAVIGSLIVAAKLQLPVHIIAVLPITDNAVSEKAYLPSDVVTAYNGKTIEVLNTDAEGRMTLADGLSYITKNYQPDVLIDLATLTGSAVRMFGDTCAAFFSNNEKLRNQLLDAADATNQRLWNLPLWEIWKDDILSDVADLKNISLKPIGDCIIAAKFLEQFIENHPCWAHLDIAGVAFGNVPYAKEKAATGYGVQLLQKYFEIFL